jgi:hypothetical protein
MPNERFPTIRDLALTLLSGLILESESWNVTPAGAKIIAQEYVTWLIQESAFGTQPGVTRQFNSRIQLIVEHHAKVESEFAFLEFTHKEFMKKLGEVIRDAPKEETRYAEEG